MNEYKLKMFEEEFPKKDNNKMLYAMILILATIGFIASVVIFSIIYNRALMK
jgi:hypothetical protein